MKSLSKNKLNAEQINAITKHAFGQAADGFTENNIGEFSALYMVKIADKEVALKIAPKDDVSVLRYERNAMKREIEALRLVKTNIGVPVPEVLFYDTSKTLCNSEYFFMEKMNGDNYDSISSELSAEQNSSIISGLGGFNRQINEIKSDKFGYDSRFNDWKTAFSNMIFDLLKDGRDAEIKFPLPREEIENIIKSFIYACDDVKIPQLVHWDLWNGNVLVQDGKISGIIDFERSLFGDILMEYYFRKFAVNKDFNAGYDIDFDTLDKSANIRLALYDLYLAIIWVVEYYYRKYDSSQLAWREEELVKACSAFEKL